jgi:hypothetical protein
MPLKGWLMLMLGASRAPLSAEEARALRKPKSAKSAKSTIEPSTTTVVVPPPTRADTAQPRPADQGSR